MPWTGRFELEATLVRRIDVVAVPDPEHPKQVGHLDLVLSTLHGPRRMNVGPVKQNARAHYIAALLREEMGLERVEVDDTVALEVSPPGSHGPTSTGFTGSHVPTCRKGALLDAEPPRSDRA